MTPKEKADELIESFAETIEPIRIGVLVERNWNNAKQCALIAVDEIIKQNVNTPTDYGASWTYWMQVKKEIENI